MADIINFRLARKTRARQTADADAAANRAKFGRTKAEKQAEQAAMERRERTLDGAKRED